MIEPELAFADLYDAMNNAENFVKFVVDFAMKKNKNDLDFFDKFVDKNLLKRLKKVVEEPFVKIEYKEAIVLLQNEIKKNASLWQFPNVEFGF
jgi:asparaginyl-tRNA synthetase